MFKNAVKKCCQMLSLPFKKKTAQEKEYQKLIGETPQENIVHSPTKKSEVLQVPTSGRSSSTKASDQDKEFSSLEASTLEMKLNSDEEISQLPKIEQIIELTTINLENPLEKYYALASEIIQNLQTKVKTELTDYEKVYEEKKHPHNLRIFLKSHVIDKKTRVSMVRSEWIAPCEPEKLLEIMNDIDQQKKISISSVDQFYAYENFGTLKNHQLMYLRYKKMLTTSPRDFVYLKCFTLIDKEKNIWVDCSKSISDDRYPEIKGETVRGEIHISGSYIEAFDNGGLKHSKVISYSEIDFKLNIPLILTKPTTVAEFRKYVERTCHIIENGKLA